MAENVKETKAVEKKSRLVEAFTKDYKYEGLILLVLAIIALVLGIWALKYPTNHDGTLAFEGAFLIGNKLGSTIFSWILIVLGGFSMILAIWPYYKPSIYEIKRVTWPTKKTMITDTVAVLIYSASFAIFFAILDILFLLIVRAL